MPPYNKYLRLNVAATRRCELHVSAIPHTQMPPGPVYGSIASDKLTHVDRRVIGVCLQHLEPVRSAGQMRARATGQHQPVAIPIGEHAAA